MVAPRARGLIRSMMFAAFLTAGVAGCSGQSGTADSRTGDGEKAGPGGPFRLIDTKGRSVTNETLMGEPYAIFFGFTRCPDVCPTTMSRMALLHKKLGADADRMNVVFVSVDPQHDKREDIASFLSMFDAPVIGLTGEPAELKRMEQSFRIYVERVPLPNGDYTIDHTARILLFDRDGRFADVMDAREPEDKAVARLKRLIHA